jgi:monoamine oxidase
MTCSSAPIAIAIVGGGLAGLYAALLLQQRGVHDLVLFEARAVLGGRILSVDPQGSPVPVPSVDGRMTDIDGIDLGPTWFWPEFQPQLDQVVSDIGLQRFEQFEAGDLLVERSPGEPPRRQPGYVSSPTSVRLLGGTGALIAALYRRLVLARILNGQTVHRLRCIDGQVELAFADASGAVSTSLFDHVLLALPPRLAERSISFDPPLPTALARNWRDTPTWMAPHAKYVALYDEPFWRAQGLSGSARSGPGPMGEIHDVSMPGGRAALFGFLGVPASVRRTVPEGVLRMHCRAQLGRLFCERAAVPVAEALKDWAMDTLTATEDDLEASGQHPVAPPSSADTGPWQGLLTGIGSEWSPQFAGYLTGAVDAATRGVQRWLSAQARILDAMR